jgi:fucose 4-O-acetylase-like acetyltransferase
MDDDLVLVVFLTVWSAISWITYSICMYALKRMQEDRDKEIELMMQVPIGAAIMKTWLLVVSIFWPVPLLFIIGSMIKQKLLGE